MKKVTTYLFLIMIVFQSCLKIESADSGDSDNSNEFLSDTEAVSADSNKIVSLTGKMLDAPDMDRWTKLKFEEKLEEAYTDYQQYPDSLEVIAWYGRRLSHLYRYHASIQVFTEGLKKFPDSFELYRHRGHRYLTIRQVDHAIDDLEKAAFYMRNEPVEIEEPSIPNSRNVPRSSIQFNVWYHLGLSYYIKGNFDKAVSAYKKCLSLANNHDMLVSVTHWLYITYHKIGNVDAAENLLAPIEEKMNVIENFQYHKLLLLYKGLLKPTELYDESTTDGSVNQLTLGYGVGSWYYNNGSKDKALQTFNKMLESPYWQAFGYLAAEMEIASRSAIAG
ncbi:tetratricopeptide repeat protein [Reichenbachiella ulvae]|uniref:Tetratricopeptide repeat protein n=1 Tax=Reichenbachiella ulvae TaxID=2980104 RepID=A0ABT3D081_9BACT|nr:tetratricopeptide repeat protein [Reichenbachiella ulvae]MCV9389219.1 tetratricopeptide repeat protein [Reichenbachiella ulvae]